MRIYLLYINTYILNITLTNFMRMKNVRIKYSRSRNKIFISRLNNHPGEMLTNLKVFILTEAFFYDYQHRDFFLIVSTVLIFLFFKLCLALHDLKLI